MTAPKPNYLQPTNLRSPSGSGFWQGLREQKLRGRCCTACSERFFPPRPRCPECLSDALEWVELSGRGTLHSWTEVHVASPDFDSPFLLGLIDLEDGLGRLTAKIIGTDAAQLTMDMPVRVTYVDLEGGFSLYCLVPE